MRLAPPLLLAGCLAAAPLTHAQTYGTVLEGENQTPPVATAAAGVALGQLLAVPPFIAESGFALLVGGAFENLESDFDPSVGGTGLHIHRQPVGADAGPIACDLTADTDADLRGATFQPDEVTGDNVCFLSNEDYAALLDERLYVNVHTVDNPGGAIRGNLRLVPTLDGDLSDAQYQPLAVKLNANAGFGPNMDVTQILVYADPESEVVFFGVAGKLDTGGDNGIGLWLNFSELDGAPAGTALGRSDIGAGHYLDGQGGGTDDDFRADFEVDYLFAINSGNGTGAYLDVMRLVGTPAADYMGNAGLDGMATLGPADEQNNAGGAPVFAQNNVAFAFDNAGTGQTGLELAIPFNQLGLDADAAARLAAGTVEAFAFVVSSSGFFSDVTVPGNVTTGNPGFNADFSALAGGPYHSAAAELPVELTAFGAVADGGALRVEWATAGETNNAYFDVALRAEGEAAFREVGQVAGAGTTAEPQRYALPVAGLQPGRYAVRLAQVDLDGTRAELGTVEVALGVAGTHALGAIAPNPTATAARLALTVARAQDVEVAVYDVLGRRVQALFAGPMAEGEARTFRVDAAALAPGAYVVRAQGEHFAETTRFTVAR